MKKIIAKIIKWVTVVVIVSLVITAVTATVLKKKSNAPTFVFGHAILRVETGSMETAIPAKSYVLVKKFDGKNLNVGDVITFRCLDKTSQVYGSLITHRITEVVSDGYKTKGDANPVEDDWIVKSDAVTAVYVKNLPVTTVLGRIFASPVGLILIAVVFLGSCIFVYVPEIMNALKDGDDTDAEAERQAEIKRRIDEEVERLKNEEGGNE